MANANYDVTSTQDARLKVSRGQSVLEGSNPCVVKTGLAVVDGFTATLKGSASPGVGTCLLTAVVNADGTVSVYAWKPTGSGDCTLIASTGVEAFNWIATGR